MSAARKIATLFLYFGEEISAEILRQLPRPTAQKVLNALSAIGKVTEEELESVVKEFQSLLNSDKKFTGLTSDAGKRILDVARKSLNLEPDAFKNDDDSVIESLKEDLSALTLDTLLPWLSRERSNTVAVVLSLMEPEAAAQAFRKLPSNSSAEICLAIAQLKKVESETLRVLAEEIAEMRKRQSNQVMNIGGKQKLTEMFQNLPQEFRNKLLSDLAEKDEALAHSLRDELLSMTRLAQLSAKDFAKLCSAMSDKELAVLVKGEQPDVVAKILSSLSSSRAQTIAEEAHLLPLAKKSDLENARRKFVTTARGWHDEGKVAFPWEDNLV